MIKPAVLLKGAVGEKAKRRAGSCAGFCGCYPITVGGDAVRGERESGRGDAPDVVMIFPRLRRFAVGACAVERQTVFLAGMFPKIKKSASFEIVQKRFVLAR